MDDGAPMAKTKQPARILVSGINLAPVFRDASVTIDQGLRGHPPRGGGSRRLLERP